MKVEEYEVTITETRTMRRYIKAKDAKEAADKVEAAVFAEKLEFTIHNSQITIKIVSQPKKPHITKTIKK